MQKKTAPQQNAMKRNAAKAAALLKQVANEQRLRILCALIEGEMSVGIIAEHTSLSQSALSQHLARMRTAALVAAEKRGQKIYYRLRSTEVRALLATLHLIYCKKN